MCKKKEEMLLNIIALIVMMILKVLALTTTSKPAKAKTRGRNKGAIRNVSSLEIKQIW